MSIKHDYSVVNNKRTIELLVAPEPSTASLGYERVLGVGPHRMWLSKGLGGILVLGTSDVPSVGETTVLILC